MFKRFLLLVTMVSCVNAHDHHYTTIASLYLPALEQSEHQDPTGVLEEQDQFTVQTLNETQSRMIAFKIMGMLHQPTSSPMLFDKQSWTNLELVSGANLLATINRTHTKLGEIAQAGLITQPITNIKELQRRQRIIDMLAHNRELHQLTTKVLGSLGEIEPFVLALYKDESPIINQVFKGLYFPEKVQSLNRSSPSLNFWRRAQDVGELLTAPVAIWSLSHAIGTGIWDRIANTWVGKIPDAALIKPTDKSTKDGIVGVFFDVRDLLLYCVAIPGAFYQSILYYRYTYKALSYLHAKYRYLAQALKHIQALAIILNYHQPLLTLLKECNAIPHLFDAAGNHSPELKKLLLLLTSGTFDRDFSYLASNIGTILATHHLMQQCKTELLPILGAIGTLDTYVSCAQLMKEFNERHCTLCYVRFASNETPYIQLTDFWNPLLSANDAIPNSIELGTNKPRIAVLTGQNTGGKSTILRGIALSIVLAQTFGIASAKKALLTPFDHVGTYMNITDNQKEKKSLFAAEVSRAKVLLDTLRQLPLPQKSFVIIDESFLGSGGEAEELSDWYARQCGTIPNLICINATHRRKLTSLATEIPDVYCNYKVEVLVDPSGALIRPYKLEPGVTHHSIAHQVRIEQGLV